MIIFKWIAFSIALFSSITSCIAMLTKKELTARVGIFIATILNLIILLYIFLS